MQTTPYLVESYNFADGRLLFKGEEEVLDKLNYPTNEGGFEKKNYVKEPYTTNKKETIGTEIQLYLGDKRLHLRRTKNQSEQARPFT